MQRLRTRLLLGTALGTAGVLLVAGVLLYTLIERALWREFDESLATKVQSLAAMMEQEGKKLKLEFDDANLPEFRPCERAEFYQVWLNEGKVFARSPSLGEGDLDFIYGPLDAPAYESVVLPDGRPGRIAGIQFTPRQDDDDPLPDKQLVVTMVIGRETVGIKGTLSQIRMAMVAVGLAAVLVYVGELAWSVRRGLKPVDRLATQIAGIEESDLGARIEHAGVPAELLPVVNRLNELLCRLEAAFRRERRFSADVAHELRTPLAGVRSMLEVALFKEREPDAYRKVIKDCLSVNQQMIQMVENLLSLARADANQLEIIREDFDLTVLIEECWQSVSARAGARQLHVDWRLGEPCMLESDRSKLALVLQNVLGNAVTYAENGGRISIELVSQNGHVKLTVANTGSRISLNDLDHVFDRFWRGDASRQAAGQHCGLGLALCKMLVELLGGSISAESRAVGEFTIVVRL